MQINREVVEYSDCDVTTVALRSSASAFPIIIASTWHCS